MFIFAEIEGELPHAIGERQPERENHSEHRAQHRGGREGEVQLKHEKHEEHIREKDTAQKPEHALQNVVLERAVGAEESRLFVNPSIFYGGNYSAPETLNFLSVSAEIRRIYKTR